MMSQYEFDNLLAKYLEGNCTDAEEKFLDEWSNKQMQIVTDSLTEDEMGITHKRLWKRIKNSISYSSFSFWFGGKKRFPLRALGVAASIFIIFTVGLFWIQSSNTASDYFFGESKDKLVGIEVKNTTENTQTITLNDGTIVLLQPNSNIIYPDKFGDHNRIVYLKGEGFFKVKRDTTKPFLVYADNLVTQVLGTSFTVKSKDKDRTAEVIVASGKVMVYQNQASAKSLNAKIDSTKTILTPNQKAVFDKATHKITPIVVEKPIALINTNIGSFIFRETPVLDILKKLEKVYGLEIIPSASLKNCLFTGDLNELELYAQLDLVCKSINAKFEIQGTKINVLGEGCE